MKSFFKPLGIAAAFLLLTSTAKAQGWNDWVNKANNVVNGNTSNGNKGNGLNFGNVTNSDAISALKEALNIGAKNAGSRLNVLNGYFGNQLIKILMPPEAQKVESTLRSIGMGDQVDKAVLSMNRAAEDAAGKAAPIFIDAIRGMSIQDGLSVLRGGQGAATNFLKQKTTTALTTAFRPVIDNALKKVNATAYWRDVFTIYNQLPMTYNKINPDLTGYVTERALAGLFTTIADEENKIRTNPAARVTDLLRRVFGS